MRTTDCPCCRQSHMYIAEEAGSPAICRRCSSQMTLPVGLPWGLIAGTCVTLMGGIVLLALGTFGGLQVFRGGLLFALVVLFYAVVALMAGMSVRTVLSTFAMFGGGMILLRLLK